MRTIFSGGYLSRIVVNKETKLFAKKYSKKNSIIVDLGCGWKPYESWFKFKKYIGVDILKNSAADIIAPAWDSTIKANSADLVILNQSLEHIEKIHETAAEIKRILKPGGLAIITVPLTMKVHSHPVPSKDAPYSNYDKKKIPYYHYDFWRFTPFGLISLFKDFEIVKLKESNGYFTTLFQLTNYFFVSLNIPILFFPIYLVNNILALIIEGFFSLLKLIKIPIVQKFIRLIYLSNPLNYILVVRKGDDK